MATTTTTIKVTADTRDAQRALGDLQNSLGRLATIGAITALTQQFISLGDAATVLSNKMKSVTTSNADATTAFQSVINIAKTVGAEVGAVGDLFQKIALVGKDMGLSLSDTTKITENFSKALTVTGTVGPAAASAMYQFGQSLGRGTVAFEDMKQLQESSAGTLALIAKQFGKTSAQFLKDVQASKVGSRDLAAALKQLGDDVDPTFNGMQKTVGQSLQNIRTSFVELIQKFEDATGAFDKLATGINWVGENLNTVLPIVAAFIGAWAATRILAIATALYEIVVALRAVGTAAAVAQALATGGLSAITAAAGAAAAYLAADALFKGLDENQALKRQADEAAKLEQAARGANKELDKTSKLKYQGPTIDLGALKESAMQYTLQARLMTSMIGLGKNRAEQEKAVADFAREQKTTYEAIAKTEAAAQIRADIAARQRAEALYQANSDAFTMQQKINALAQTNSLEALKITTYDQIRVQYGDAITRQQADSIVQNTILLKRMEDMAAIVKDRRDSTQLIQFYEANVGKMSEVELAIKEQVLAVQQQLGYELNDQAKKEIEIAETNRQRLSMMKEINSAHQAATQNLSFYGSNLSSMNSNQLDTEMKVLEAQRRYGDLLTDELKQKIRSTAESEKQLDYLRQMKSGVEAVTKVLKGAEAGAMAAGQLGNLLPVDAAMTAQQSLMNGLQELRNQDLINEQQYQDAKVAANAAAMSAMYDATKKKFEGEQTLRIQALVGDKFSFDSIKSMASDAAAFQMKTDLEKTQFGIQQASELFSAAGKENKRAFEAAKAFNIANAVMNTYMAATKALATYPFPFGLIAAAAAVAAGMAQVSAIRSQTYSGRALGGPVMGNESYLVGERGPEIFTPATSGKITRNNQIEQGQPVTVNFNISTVDASGFDSLLVQRRGLITSMIADAQLEKGRRG